MNGAILGASSSGRTPVSKTGNSGSNPDDPVPRNVTSVNKQSGVVELGRPLIKMARLR